MATTSTILSFDSSTLLSYYQAKLSVAAAAASASSSTSGSSSKSSSNSATSDDVAPWSTRDTSSTIAKDAEVLSLTDYVDTSNVPTVAATADQKVEQDNQKLFAIYKAITNMQYLAKMAERDDVTSGQITGYNKRFQEALSQIEDYIGSTTFNNFSLQKSAVGSSITSAISIASATFGYTGSTVVNDNNLGSALAGVSSTDKFTITVTKGGTPTDVEVDLSKMTGDLTLGNIISYANQQLSDAGFTTRLKRVVTDSKTDKNDKVTDYYGISLATGTGESISLSGGAASSALYLAGTSGLTEATTSTTTKSTTSTTTSTAQNNQGRLVKLSDLSDPTSTFSETVDPATGNTTAQSTVVDADGNVYMLGNATGDFGSQLNQATEDVYLTKYDSVGNQLWAKLLGSSSTASGYGLAVDPTGGVVVVGSTTSDLVSGAVADGNTDSFITKYNDDGSENWTTQIATLADNTATAVNVDASGNIYIGGQVDGVIGAGQTNSGGTDAYLAKLNSKGKVVSETQYGTSGDDSVAATALTDNGDLLVATMENGHAILSKYAGGDIAADPAWTQDLGALGTNCTIGGIAVSGTDIYISGSTTNTSLASNVVEASSGGQDAFVLSLSDGGSSVETNYVSYVGTAAKETAGNLVVGSDGTIYLTGTTTGTFDGQTRNASDTNNAFVTALSSDGTVNWTKQYGGLGGQSTGASIAIDDKGSSVLDALGLARGELAAMQGSSDLESATTLRTGDYFKIKIDTESSTRTATITIDDGETMRSLAAKINAQLGDYGTASIKYNNGKSLKIEASSGIALTLVSGTGDSDALAGLGIAAGTLTDGTLKSSTSSNETTYGLGLDSAMEFTSTTGATAIAAKLKSVLSAVQSIYQATNSTSSTASASTSTSPSSLSTTLSSYYNSTNTKSAVALSLLA
jgi:hypothetical protein